MNCAGYGDSNCGDGLGNGASPRVESVVHRDGETPHAGVDSVYEPVNSVGEGDGGGDGENFYSPILKITTEHERFDYSPTKNLLLDELAMAVIEVRLWSRRP